MMKKIKSGYYKVQTQADLPGAPGIIILDENGIVRGADGAYLYNGALFADGDVITGSAKIVSYDNKAQNVFGNSRNVYVLNFSGKIQNDVIRLSAPNPMVETGQAIFIECTFLVDLDAD